MKGILTHAGFRLLCKRKGISIFWPLLLSFGLLFPAMVSVLHSSNPILSWCYANTLEELQEKECDMDEEAPSIDFFPLFKQSNTDAKSMAFLTSAATPTQFLKVPSHFSEIVSPPPEV